MFCFFLFVPKDKPKAKLFVPLKGQHPTIFHLRFIVSNHKFFTIGVASPKEYRQLGNDEKLHYHAGSREL